MPVLDGDNERGQIQRHKRRRKFKRTVRQLQDSTARIVSTTEVFGPDCPMLIHFISSYGELGYLIIHQTIYQLFSPETIDPDSTSPLTPSDFIQRILVPEATVYLIMDDLQLSYSSAAKTLRESVEYGVAMFPDTGGDSEGMKAVDDVVKESARARRKQLLDEEMEVQEHGSEMEVELELSKPSPSHKLMTPKKARSKRGKIGAKMASDTTESDRVNEPQTRTQHLPTTKTRKTASGYRSDASTASDASITSRRSTRSMTRQISRVGPPPPLPTPRQREFASLCRGGTSPDRTSDVEIIPDPRIQSNRLEKCAHTESTPDRDPDEELLNSSPLRVGQLESWRALSAELVGLGVDETPKPRKIGGMKLDPDPWGGSSVPAHQVS